MCLQLVILNKNRKSRDLWFEQLSEYESIEIVSTNQEFLGELSTLDAVLMSGQSAHERYGGIPRYGTSQILSTCHDRVSPMSPWVISMPSLSPIRDDTLDDGQIVENLFYKTFRIIFSTINSFNSSIQSQKIGRLGIDLDYVGIRPSQSLEKAKGVTRAYSEYGLACEN